VSKGGPPRFTVKLDFGGQKAEVSDALGRIDLDNLRDEVQDAGAQVIYYGGLHARAKRRASEAETLRDVTWSRLAKEARDNAFKRNDKLTDKAVGEFVQTHAEYQAAVQHWLDTTEQADLLENVKFTLARKQSTLEAIASLLIQEEFARRGPALSAPVPPRRTPVKYD
jgi:hypothetical protein